MDLLEHERWDYVVLQEQSQIPARPDLRAELMLPAAAKLDVMARQAGAETVLFMTWAREHGDPDAVRGDTYAAMQARLDEGYLEASAMLDASVPPVGTHGRRPCSGSPASGSGCPTATTRPVRAHI